MARDYREKLEADNVALKERSRACRDVADGYPGPGDLDRRAACARDFKRFAKVYFPAAFPMPWSKDHRRVIERIEDVVLHGGLSAIAMPRGSGKTTLVERATLWSLLYGRRRFVALIGATEGGRREHAAPDLKPSCS